MDTPAVPTMTVLQYEINIEHLHTSHDESLVCRIQGPYMCNPKQGGIKLKVIAGFGILFQQGTERFAGRRCTKF